MKSAFSGKIMVILAAATLYFTVPKAMHAQESGLLMGGLYSIGDDGAAEAGENPAYLASAKHKAGRSVHARTAGFHSGNVVLSSLPLKSASQQTASADMAIAWRSIAGGRWSAGFAVSDVRAPLYQRLALEGSQASTVSGLDISIKTQSVDQQHGFATGIAWQLSPKESLGARIRYTHRYFREKENLSAPQSTTVTFSSELVTEQHVHQLHGTLSYLYSTPAADFTLIAGNFGSQQNIGAFAYSSVISTSANPVFAATQDSSAYANSTTLDPFFLVGTRKRLFQALNIFFEAGAQPTVRQNTSDNFYRKDGSQKATIRRDITREGEIATTLGTGIALNLSDSLTWHAGARYQTSRIRISMLAADNLSRYLENTNVRFLQAATGISWRRNNYTWQFGATYQYQNVELEKRSSYADTGGDKTSQSNLAVEVNTYGAFFAVAADF